MRVALSVLFLISCLELLFIFLLGPLFIITLYFMGSLSLIYSISKTRIIFVLLSLFPLLIIGGYSIALKAIDESCAVVGYLLGLWFLVVIIAVLSPKRFPNTYALQYRIIEQVLLYLIALVPFVVIIFLI